MKLKLRWRSLVVATLAAAILLPTAANAARPRVTHPSKKSPNLALPVPILNPSIRDAPPKPLPSPKGPRDVLVQLDARKIEKRANEMRTKRKLQRDDKRVRAYKKSAHKALAKSLEKRLGRRGLVAIESYRNFPLVLVSIESEADRKWLLRQPGVRSVFEDQINEPHLIDSLLQIGQPIAAQAGHTGARQSIAILDSGADLTNPALSGRVRFSGRFHEADDGNADTNEHGTNVAAIAAAVAPDADILSMDVFEDIDGENLSRASSQLRAIDFVIDTRDMFNTVAINMSLGSAPDGRCNAVQEDAFRAARNAGIATIVSAGNDSSLDAIGTPACAPSAISVGAVNEIDRVASFSNSADDLDILAPGERVAAGGIIMSGTSQAAPHVAGAWAVMSSARPGLDLDGILDVLQTTGVPIIDGRQGRETPRLQLNAALNLTVVEILTPVIGYIGCQTQVVTDLALCGAELVADTVTDAAECGMETVTSAARCGYQTVTSAAECGVELVTNAAACGWDTLTLGLLDDRDGLICSCANWSCSCEIPASCEQPATCEIVATCEVPASCTGFRECDPAVESCDALTCEVETCGF